MAVDRTVVLNRESGFRRWVSGTHNGQETVDEIGEGKLRLGDSFSQFFNL